MCDLGREMGAEVAAGNSEAASPCLGFCRSARLEWPRCLEWRGVFARALDGEWEINSGKGTSNPSAGFVFVVSVVMMRSRKNVRALLDGLIMRIVQWSKNYVLLLMLVKTQSVVLVMSGRRFMCQTWAYESPLAGVIRWQE